MAKRVFFSFHYKDVAEFRANVVRSHRVVKGGEAEYFDASLWEETKKKGDLAIKKMINDGIERTTATTVLIGSETYARRWVRYEIMKSLQRGNLLLGIHINNVGSKDQTTKAAGPNPFAYLGYCPATIKNEQRRQLKLSSSDNYKTGAVFRGISLFSAE